MQLKIRRSQKSGLTGGAIFVLDVMAELDKAEEALVSKYRLSKQLVYQSDSAAANRDRAIAGQVSALGNIMMDKLTKRAFTLGNLVNGQHIECKDLDEVMGAEAQVHEACRNIRTYLEVARSFDGSERVVDVEPVTA